MLSRTLQTLSRSLSFFLYSRRTNRPIDRKKGVPSGDGEADKAPPALAPGSVEVRTEQERRRRGDRPGHQHRSSPRGGGGGGILRVAPRRQRCRLPAHRADGAPHVSHAPAPGAPPDQAKDSLRGVRGGQALHPSRHRRRARELVAAATPAKVEALGIKDERGWVGIDPRRERKTPPLRAGGCLSGEACAGWGCAGGGGGGHGGDRGSGRRRSGGARVGVAEAEGPVDAADAGGAAVEYGEGRGVRAAAAGGSAGG